MAATTIGIPVIKRRRGGTALVARGRLDIELTLLEDGVALLGQGLDPHLRVVGQHGVHAEGEVEVMVVQCLFVF